MIESNRRRWWVLLFVALLAASTLAAPAMAISATANGTPNGAQVGENVSATVTLTNLYTEAPDSWQLHGTTELDRATWTVTAYSLDGSELATRSFDGRSFRVPVRAARNVSRIELTVTGTAPMVRNFTYRPEERFVLASLSRGQDETPKIIRTWSVHHYTAESQAARRKINATQAAIAEDGGNDELEEQVDFAIAAYRNGNFGLATAIADDAKDAAEQLNYPVELLTGLVLGGIVVALATAGIRSYRTRRREDTPWHDR